MRTVLAFACTLLPGGAPGDRIGSKRAFIGGFAVFGLPSVGCMLAPSIGFLIGMRVLQGIGASTLVPCSLALISHAVGDDGKTARESDLALDRDRIRGACRGTRCRRSVDRDPRLARNFPDQHSAVLVKPVVLTAASGQRTTRASSGSAARPRSVKRSTSYRT